MQSVENQNEVYPEDDPLTFFLNLQQRNKRSLNVVCSRALNKATLIMHPLFLYHAGRTGGVGFYIAFKWTYELIMNSNDIPDPPRVLRVGGDFIDGIPEIDDEILSHDYAFVATHSPFGIHNKFGQGFNLVSLIRDPIARISSVYTKNCMRSAEPASKLGFKKFLKETALHNEMVSQICGLEIGMKISKFHLDQARNTLHQQFPLYGTTEDSIDLLSCIFSRMNLPNLISDIPNRTLPQYAIEIREFEDQIAERNSLDLELYRWVAENPRIEPSELSNAPSPITVIIYETEKDLYKILKTSLAVVRSRLPVGSSAKIICGSFIKALAIAILCISPTDISVG